MRGEFKKVEDTIVGLNVKKIIKQKGLNEYAVAQKCGYNNKKFNDMLNGRRLIKPEDVIRFVTVLKVTPNDLYYINGNT